jgi:hypothetical protein
VVQGGNVTFSVQIAGSSPPFGIEWRKIGQATSLASNTISGNTDFLTLQNVSAANSGMYRLILRHTPTAFTTNIVFSLAVLTDSDGDGLPDKWENDYFQSNTGANPADDADGDGYTNGQEYTAGTNPTNATDFLRIDQIRLGPPLTLEFLAVSNKTYTLLYKDSLQAPAWSPLVDVVGQPTTQPLVIMDNANQPQRIYRLVTPVTPRRSSP